MTEIQISARPPRTPPIMAPVLFPGLSVALLSPIGSATGGWDSLTTELDSVFEPVVDIWLVVEIVSVWLLVGDGNKVSVVGFAPQAIYENPASVPRARIRVEQY